MRIIIRFLLIIVFSTAIFPAPNAIASGEISVLKVDTMVGEKGSSMYTISIKAFVKNLSEEPVDAKVNIVALDREGFELENVTLSGHVKQGKTTLLIDIIKMPKETYGQVDRWEWKE